MCQVILDTVHKLVWYYSCCTAVQPSPTSEQDERAEVVLRQIDAKNQEAGGVDEFDL